MIDPAYLYELTADTMGERSNGLMMIFTSSPPTCMATAFGKIPHIWDWNAFHGVHAALVATDNALGI